jgi:antitoxin (DNA-binding transcriptional repressor) of toxin-antitoxin stability system
MVEWPSTLNKERCIVERMTVRAEIGTTQLADLIKHVQAGDEVLLTQGNKPVAKLVSAVEEGIYPGTPLQIRSLKGHRVLTPTISQEDLADELFARR